MTANDLIVILENRHEHVSLRRACRSSAPDKDPENGQQTTADQTLDSIVGRRPARGSICRRLSKKIETPAVTFEIEQIPHTKRFYFCKTI